MNTDRFKFRAWDKENKVLHYNAECAYDSMNGTPPLMHDSFGALLDDDDFIIEQCTGLKDRNGKLIFEGDVLSYGPDSIPYLVYVQWDINQCRFIFRRFDIDQWQISINMDTASKMTIRYNIHEMEVTKCNLK